ncbi:unnamed protein product, partial [Ectocarpus sp. 12 AP-2014]
LQDSGDNNSPSPGSSEAYHTLKDAELQQGYSPRTEKYIINLTITTWWWLKIAPSYIRRSLLNLHIVTLHPPHYASNNGYCAAGRGTQLQQQLLLFLSLFY